jgi:hypothetical protein
MRLNSMVPNSSSYYYELLKAIQAMSSPGKPHLKAEEHASREKYS